MKKMQILIAVVLIFLLSGCGQVTNTDIDKFNVVTSFYPTYIFTKNIVKNVPNVSVSNITNGHTGCLHDYNLDINSMKQIENADVFIINGAGMETFLQKVYDRDGIIVVDSSENVEPLSNKFGEGNNEHIWLSITNAITQVENIGNALAKADKDNENRYLENMNEYTEKLKALRNELRESLYGNKDEIKIVTDHDAFPYFAKDFGIEIIDVIEREEGESPTSKEMKAIIDNIKENNVCGIFIGEDSSDKLANIIAQEAGTEVHTLNIISSGSGDLDDYENKMRSNIAAIRESIL